MKCRIIAGAKISLLSLLENKSKIIVPLFFLIFLLIGLSIFRDYGIHWDDCYDQAFGKSWYTYIHDFISQGSATFKEFSFSQPNSHYFTHGPSFELFLAFVKNDLLHLKDSRDVLFLRHLFVFLVFYLAVISFYLLCKLHFQSWKTALLGCVFLILHPRIFAHSFFNSMDIPFLSFYLISTYSLIRYLKKKTYFRAIFHALSCAILIDIRVVGGILPLCTLIFINADLFKFKKDKQELKKIIKTFLVYIILLSGLTILFWPKLWQDPIGNLLKAIGFSIKFIRSDLPSPVWCYHPKWIAVTTPILYSFLFIIGFLLSLKGLFKNPIKAYPQNRTILTVLFLFLPPIVLTIIYKPIIYNGWRQHYFVYPFFVIFLLIGLQVIFKFIRLKFQGLSYKIIKISFILIIVVSLSNTVLFMVKYHPHQHIYANILAGKKMQRAKEFFALDYWGLSYRQALEYILENDKSKIVKLYVNNLPGETNAGILPCNERARLRYVRDMEEADYFLSNYSSADNYKYKWHKGEYPQKAEYYSLKVGDVKFMVVYKLMEEKMKNLGNYKEFLNKE